MEEQRKIFGGVIVTLFTFVFIYSGFGSLLALLLLYLKYGLQLPANQAIAINSAFLALVYSSSIVGGYLGGKYSYKSTILWGLLLGFLGLAAIATSNLLLVYFGLSVFIVSYGFTVPNIMCFLGQIFKKEDPKRSSSFTAAYVAMNIGAISSMISAGFLSEILSYKFTFFLFSLAMLLGFIVFLFGHRFYKFVPGTACHTQTENNSKFKGFPQAILLTLVSVPLLMVLLQYSELSNYVIIFLGVSVFIWAFFIAGKAETAADRKSTRMYLILLMVSVVFWILYMLQPSTITLFIKTNVNKNFFGLNIPAASFYSLNPIFIVILGAIFSAYFAKTKFYSQLPTIYKFVLGIIVTGLGYIILVPGVLSANALGLVAVYWIVLTYFLQTCGEIIIGPTAYAMVGELVPTKFEGIMMGLRQITMGLGGALSMLVAQFALSGGALPKDPVKSNPHYMYTFLAIGGITIGIGLLVLIAAMFFLRNKQDVNSSADPKMGDSAA